MPTFRLTQATEVGSVYSLAELQMLSETARKFGLRVQMKLTTLKWGR